MSSQDDEVRDSLSRDGDDGAIPRHTIFYFYGGDIAGIERAALAEQFSVRPTLESEGLILEKTMSVDAVSFASVAEKMEAWATRFGAEYDGWECALMAGG